MFKTKIMHTGLDIRAPAGTPVKAAAAGEVLFAGWRKQGGKPRHFVTSAYEHSCVYECFRALEAQGHTVTYLRPGRDGHVSAETVANAVCEETALVSVMHVNNETGARNDIGAIAAAVKHKNPEALFHSDGVQGFIKCPVDLKHSQIDYYTASAHKLHALKGTGALFFKENAPLGAYLLGGGQERTLRSGTENTFGAEAFAYSISRYLAHYEEYIGRIRAAREAFMASISGMEGLHVVSPEADCAPHILNIALECLRGEVLLHALEAEGILVGIGSACSSKKGRQSRVHAALGLSRELSEGVLRISFSCMNTKEEAQTAGEAILREAAKLRRFTRR